MRLPVLLFLLLAGVVSSHPLIPVPGASRSLQHERWGDADGARPLSYSAIRRALRLAAPDDAGGQRVMLVVDLACAEIIAPVACVPLSVDPFPWIALETLHDLVSSRSRAACAGFPLALSGHLHPRAKRLSTGCPGRAAAYRGRALSLSGRVFAQKWAWKDRDQPGYRIFLQPFFSGGVGTDRAS